MPAAFATTRAALARMTLPPAWGEVRTSSATSLIVSSSQERAGGEHGRPPARPGGRLARAGLRGIATERCIGWEVTRGGTRQCETRPAAGPGPVTITPARAGRSNL